MDIIDEITYLGSNNDAEFATLMVYLVLIPPLVLCIPVVILKVITNILDPMNVELDMRTKDFCKNLAEIDNSLVRFRGSRQPRQTINSNDYSTIENRPSADCATSLHDRVTNSSDKLNNSDFKSETLANNQSFSSDDVDGPVYPNGWIPLVESSKVRAGTVRKAIIMGRDVIVTRSADGKQVNVLDAYCPHVGVHIGVNGRVRQVDDESCVECPFHGWTFRASDGQCVKIPYQEKSRIPKLARLGTWDCAEVDNFIYIWHHSDGLAPSWYLERSEEIMSGEWQLAGRSCHRTNLELRDMHENGADLNHFEGIHNDLFIFGSRVATLKPLHYLQDYMRHHWQPHWRPILDESGKVTHMAEMTLQSWIKIFKLRLFDITVRAIQIGPARVNLYYDSEWYGKGLLIMNAVPVGGRQTKYIQHIYTKRSLFQFFMAKWVLYGEINMLERDFFIWNHKKTLKNPILVPEDRTLKQFRSWYSQFYKRRRTITISTVDKFKSLDATVTTNKLSCKDAFDF